MKKVSTLVTVLVVFGVLLAACAPGTDTNRTGTPGTSTGSNSALTPGTSTGSNSALTPGTPAGSNSALTPGIPVTGNGTSTPNAAMPTTKVTVATSPTTNANSTVDASPTMKATTSVSSTSMPSTGMNTSLLSNQMHFKVVDQQNQTIGQVKDLVLDLTARKLAYVVVTTSGSTASSVSGDMAIPWNMLSVKDSKTSVSSNSSALATSTPANLTPVATLKSDTSSMDKSDGVFVFTGDAKMLSNAPAFKTSDMPEMGKMSNEWDSTLSNYWKGNTVKSTTAAATASPSMTETPATTSTKAAGQTMTAVPLQGVILASKLIGSKVMDNNKEIAKVSDVVVDVSTGMVTYAIMTVNDKLIPVPLSSVGWDSANQALVGVGGLTVLQGAPSFGLTSLPTMEKSDWDAQLKTYWKSQTQLSPMP